jgi:hypothetical protein
MDVEVRKAEVEVIGGHRRLRSAPPSAVRVGLLGLLRQGVL